MKLINFPVKEQKDVSELINEILTLIESYQINYIEAIGLLEVIKAELLDGMYDN
jgi:hypothetical protein